MIKLRTIPPLTELQVKNFFDKVDTLVERGDCWIWLAHKNKTGYGMFAIGMESYLSHRISFYIKNNIDPKDKLVLHKCDNRACVRPEHLFLGTNQDNSDDCKAKGRLAVGERNGLKAHPEKASRGKDHFTYKNPEKITRGIKHGSAKLTEQDVLEIRNLYFEGQVTYQDLADKYKVKNSTIAAIIKGLSWSHLENKNKCDLNGIKKGSTHYKSSLTEEIVLGVRKMYSELNLSAREGGVIFGISGKTAYNIVSRQTWNHI